MQAIARSILCLVVAVLGARPASADPYNMAHKTQFDAIARAQSTGIHATIASNDVVRRLVRTPAGMQRLLQTVKTQSILNVIVLDSAKAKNGKPFGYTLGGPIYYYQRSLVLYDPARMGTPSLKIQLGSVVGGRLEPGPLATVWEAGKPDGDVGAIIQTPHSPRVDQSIFFRTADGSRYDNGLGAFKNFPLLPVGQYQAWEQH